MSTTRNRFPPHWVSSGMCERHTIKEMPNAQQIFFRVKKYDAIQIIQYSNIGIMGVSFKITLTHVMDKKSLQQAFTGVWDHFYV